MSSLNNNNNPTSPSSQLGNHNRRPYNSSEPDSDRLSNPFTGLNKDSLSLISAPFIQRGGIKHNLFASASIAGHMITQALPFDNGRSAAQPQSSFLEKFGSVADRTRDLENGLSSLSVEDPKDRSASFGADHQQQQQQQQLFNLGHTSPNSLHETLNNSSSRHQSVSEKIDIYQQEQERRLSFSSELIASDNGSTTTDHHQQIKHNIWNPASAPTFQPSNFQQSQQPVPPMFMNNSGINQMFPNMYSPFLYPPHQQPFQPSFPQQPAPVAEGGDLKDEAKIPGVNGILNRSMSPAGGFMMPPFVPYGLFSPPPFPQTPPLMPVAPQDEDGRAPVANMAPPPLNLRDGPSPSQKGGKKNSKAPLGNGPQSAKSNNRSRNGPSYIQRSPLLEEFRANTSGKEYKLNEIYGHGIEFSKDQHGSRFIQAQLSNSSEEEKEVIFNEIREVAFELMSDVFGNYVIQKYFEFGNDVQRKILLESMMGHVKELSLQMYGCRVVQRAIEHIEMGQKLKLISELNDSNIILECCKDANGNHVIQKLIEIIPIDKIDFIFNSINDQIYHLSTNSFGCRVIQKLLEFGDINQCEFIVSVLEKYIDVLLIDKFGNYVIQYILTNESNCDTDRIVKIVNDTILKDFTKLSLNKFSSNVVESFIMSAPAEKRIMIKRQTMEDNNAKLTRLINDPYGNYVIQKLVTVDSNLQDEVSKKFVLNIRSYLDDAGNTNSKLSIEKLRNIVKSIS